MRKKILIVEGDLITQAVYREAVPANTESFYVSTASRALAFMGMVSPDLIFLDLDLPDGDGLEIIHTLRNNNRDAKVPVVVVTSSTNEERHLAAKSAGAQSVITKPFNATQISDAIAGLSSLEIH